MAIGRHRGPAQHRGGYGGGSAGAPKRAPGLQGVAAEALLLADIHGWTVTARAAELAAPAKRMRTYLGGRKPSYAERLPATIPEPPNYRRVRETIIARSRVLRGWSSPSGPGRL